MSKIIDYVFMCSFLCMPINACTNDDSLVFNYITSSVTVFGVKKTNFMYNNYYIYSINTPYNGLYSNFLKHNYFILKNNSIYEITLYTNCKIAYEQHDYTIRQVEKGKSYKFSFCDIYVNPIFDFSMKPSTSTVGINGAFTKLEWKRYDSELKDTVYQFIRRQVDSNDATVTNISKKYSFIGVYETEATKNGLTLIKNPFGKTYLKNFHSSFINPSAHPPLVELGLVKEFINK